MERIIIRDVGSSSRSRKKGVFRESYEHKGKHLYRENWGQGGV